MRPFLRTPLAKAIVFLAVCAVCTFYAVLFALRGLDVKSCERQIPVREAAIAFYRTDATFQRALGISSHDSPRTRQLRFDNALRWDRLADGLTVPKCDGSEIPLPWPF